MQATAGTLSLASCLLLLAATSASCLPNQSLHQHQHQHQRQQLSRRSSADQEAPIVMGKFKAPAPDRMVRARIPKGTDFASQTMSASYRISELNQDNLPEKIVHGVAGSSLQSNRKDQRTVSAKMQVSDEGLNYPPSKLSADIHGNVAEIVTAPPEMVEQDFLEPQVSKLFGSRRAN